MGRAKGSRNPPGSRKPGRKPDKKYGEDVYAMTLQEVGDELGVCRERIRQIEVKALAKLRAGLEERGIDAELWFSHLADLNRMERTTSVVRIAPTRLARFERKAEEAESCGFATAE